MFAITVGIFELESSPNDPYGIHIRIRATRTSKDRGIRFYGWEGLILFQVVESLTNRAQRPVVSRVVNQPHHRCDLDQWELTPVKRK